MQATAESMHLVALRASDRFHGIAAPPPEGFPQDGAKACKTCGAACYGEQCRACWSRAQGSRPREGMKSSAYIKACAKCGKPCQGTTCRACYFKSRKERQPDRVVPICPGFGDEKCGKPLSTALATHCRKHAARGRMTSKKLPASLRRCQPGNMLHAMTGGRTCQCGAFYAIGPQGSAGVTVGDFTLTVAEPAPVTPTVVRQPICKERVCFRTFDDTHYCTGCPWIKSTLRLA